jgi:cobalt-zinc-cadmium efflux system outer membrane protein
MAVRAELENWAGTGSLSGLGGAELTLTLASVLERGGKRDARRAFAASTIDGLATRRMAAEIDLLAEVARRYLELVAAQARQRIAADELAQRERTAAAAQRRVQAGASPESVHLAAEAMKTRAEIDVARARTEGESAWRRLAILWGEPEAGPSPRAAGEPLDLPSLPDIAGLLALLEQTPQLRLFADQARVLEARLQLAQSSRATDLEWQVGVRNLQAGDDWALVAGVAVPIGTARRAEPSIRAARAAAEALAVERESTELVLEATLIQAHGQFAAATMEVAKIREDLLPRLARAESSAERAYRAGALSYLEWAQLQTEMTAARRQQLTAAVDAHRALIEIQRLTGEPLVAPAAEAKDAR